MSALEAPWLEQTRLARRRTYLASLRSDLADARMKTAMAADAFMRLGADASMDQLAPAADRLERAAADLEQRIARIREESEASPG